MQQSPSEPLKNSRHERFVLALLEGQSVTAAYEIAGYKPDRKNAARLTQNDDIRRRLNHLKAEVAAKSEVTVQSLLNELEDARQKASNLSQLSAAVRERSKSVTLAIVGTSIPRPRNLLMSCLLNREDQWRHLRQLIYGIGGG